jgi:DNA-binding response OmpR family regulator
MGQKILIVDDSRTVCQAVKYAFTASPFVVDSAATAADALRVLRSGEYSAAIVDYALPDGPGVQLLRLIRTEPSLARLPIVFLTGSFHPFNLDEALAAGADVTLAKPFKTDDLLARVNDAILAAPSRSPGVTGHIVSPAIPVAPAAAEPSASQTFAPASTGTSAAEDDEDDFDIVTADELPLTTTAPQVAASTARPVAPLPPPPMTGGFRRVLPPPGPDPVRRMPLVPPPPAPIRGAAGAPPARNLAETTQHEVAPDSLSMMAQAPVGSDSGVYHAADARVVDPVNEAPHTSGHSSRPTDGTPFATDAVADATSPANDEPVTSSAPDIHADQPVDDEVTVEVTEEVAQDVTEEVDAEDITEEVAEEDITEVVAEEVAAEEVTEAVAEEVAAEEVTEAVAEEVAAEDPEDDFAPATPVVVPGNVPTETVVPAQAAQTFSADDLRAAVAAKLDEELVRSIVRELLPGIVKEYLAVMLRQTATKLESYSTQKIDAFVENDLNLLARAAIDKYLENLQ